MIRSIFIFLGLLLTFFANAQGLDHIQGEVIVQLKPDVSNPAQILRKYATYRGRKSRVQTKKCLSEVMNIWQLKFDFSTIHERKFLADLRKDKAVYTAQLNHLLTPRNTPNDPEFNAQWQYINSIAQGGNPEADLDADLAWDITTGGVTANGDTIVIVALDDGVDLNHEDWEDNLWKNHAEIPGNDIDDDQNGYIDDVFGWNPGSNSGSVGSGASHGTPVMGIMGAKGNNGIGVAGVNWDVKVMMVKTDFNADEATLIAGYGYPLALRKLYNESNGEKGAFIVATNASWGTDNGMPEDAPIWCALYDSLGTVGILNCGATANENINVDVVGDLPTTCPSDYLIGVTNVNMVGEKENQAGYGKKNIDLGAFGEDAYTLKNNNRYGAFGGTSGATPHVTGAIGLLYAAPCNNFADLARNNPSAAALLVRQYILDGVKPNESLDTFTVTGGQLNLNNSLQLLMQGCGACIMPLGIEVSNIMDVSVVLNWAVSTSETTTTLRYKIKGTSQWMTLNNVVAPYTLKGLMACSEYEFQLGNQCGDENSGFTRTFEFKTDGCCIFPENIRIVNSTNQSLTIGWGPLFAAQGYEIQFKESSQSTATIVATDTNFIQFQNLTNCTDYNFQVRTICANMTTNFSPTLLATTAGCGSCTDVPYCASTADGDFEWISLVKLNTLNHESGSENGYGDYTGLSTDLTVQASYELALEISYSNFPFEENVQAWIDYNQDGIFDEETENIINLDEDILSEFTGSFTIPNDATPGLTRLRIAIKWREGSDVNKPGPCDSYDFGEVEDYCVNILPNLTQCTVPTQLELIASPSKNSAFIGWKAEPNTSSYQYQYRVQGMTEWIQGNVENEASISLLNLESCTTYEIQTQSLCDSMMVSGFSDLFVFNTACDVAVTETPLDVQSLSVFPSPFSTYFSVEIDLNSSTDLSLNLYDTAGKLIQSRIIANAPTGKSTFSFESANIPSGIYLLGIETEKGKTVRRLIKM